MVEERRANLRPNGVSPSRARRCARAAVCGLWQLLKDLLEAKHGSVALVFELSKRCQHLARLFAIFHLLYSPTPKDTDLQLFCVCQGYIRALEKQERNHQLQQEETLAVNVTNSKVSLQCPLSIPGLRLPISSCLGALKSKEDNCNA